MIKIVKASFGVVLLVAFLAVCNFEQAGRSQENEDGETTAVVSPPTVEEVPVTISPLEPSPTPAVCTPLPEGMRLRIVPESETTFIFELAGFQSGESLVFLLIGEAEGHGTQLETRPVARVDANGEFRSDRFDLGHFLPIAEWQGKVIYTRGVACFDINLPLPAIPIELGGAF